MGDKLLATVSPKLGLFPHIESYLSMEVVSQFATRQGKVKKFVDSYVNLIYLLYKQRLQAKKGRRLRHVWPFNCVKEVFC